MMSYQLAGNPLFSQVHIKKKKKYTQSLFIVTTWLLLSGFFFFFANNAAMTIIYISLLVYASFFKMCIFSFLFIYLFLAVLWFELKALHLLGRHSTIRATPLAQVYFVCVCVQ
jgi:hypothetical protein